MQQFSGVFLDGAFHGSRCRWRTCNCHQHYCTLHTPICDHFCKLNIFASPENNIPPVYVCRLPLVISLLLSLHSSRLLRFHLIECWQLLYISFFWELYETLNHIDSLLHTDLVPSGFFFVFLLGHLFLLLAISFWLLFDNLLCLHHFSFVYQKVRFLFRKMLFAKESDCQVTHTTPRRDVLWAPWPCSLGVFFHPVSPFSSFGAFLSTPFRSPLPPSLLICSSESAFFLGKCYSPNNQPVRELTCTLADMFFGLPRIIWCWYFNPFHQKILFSFLNLHFDDFLNLTDILSFFAFLVNLIRIQEKCRPFVISSFCVVLILWCRNQWLLKNNGLGIVLKWK